VLRAWLRVIVRRSAIDYMRASPEFERATAHRPDRWISLASLTSAAPAAAESIVEQRRLVLSTTRDLVDRAARAYRAEGDRALTRLAQEWRLARLQVRRLATRGDQMIAVLVAVLEGRAQGDTAAALGLTPREVELTVRYLEELLRARFAEP
jgi:DNA-directed RNA polymerase specialized sigma24 family protein